MWTFRLLPDLWFYKMKTCILNIKTSLIHISKLKSAIYDKHGSIEISSFSLLNMDICFQNFNWSYLYPNMGLTKRKQRPALEGGPLSMSLTT